MVGKSYYITYKPTGNIFVEFCSATWAGIKGNFKDKSPKDQQKAHFMDYALGDILFVHFSYKILFYLDSGHSARIVRDAKFVFPIIVMYLPLPFFWALFDMQGYYFI